MLVFIIPMRDQFMFSALVSTEKSVSLLVPGLPCLKEEADS